MSNKGEIVVGFASHDNFMIYNPNDDSLRPVIIDFDFDESRDYGEIYVESLVSPF